MALRVLLADESTTIKKVMQLALQDFAVEVKAVHVGVDVVEVARQFQPDIIFADVLLQKKNGYEVCTELKADSQLRSIPVVLMWSSFMDLDEALAKSSGADRRLEKPFDIENLRTLLLELVPKTHTQRLAHFLKFPASFSEPLKTEEAAKEERQQPTAPPVSAAPPPPPPPPKPTASPAGLKIPQASAAPRPITSGIASSMPQPPPSGPPPPPKDQIRDGSKADWNMDSFEDISKFEPTSLSVVEETPDFGSATADDDDDEVFSELRLQGPQRNQQAAPAQAPAAKPRNFDADATATREIPLPTAPQDETDESWSHQDLSRFKIEMPPVTASNPEFGIEMELPDENADYPLQPSPFQPRAESAVSNAYLSDERQPDNDLLLNQDEIENADFSLESADFQMDQPYQPSSQPSSAQNPLGHLELTSLEDEAEEQDEPTYRIENPLGAKRSRSQAQNSDENEFPVNEVGQIPQLSPERLEQIIRAQAREIVESVVRKIVPDLATDIIREELQRLLEDTSVRDPRRDNY